LPKHHQTDYIELMFVRRSQYYYQVLGSLKADILFVG